MTIRRLKQMNLKEVRESVLLPDLSSSSKDKEKRMHNVPYTSPDTNDKFTTKLPTKYEPR
jgi:hypothetical protein